MDLQTTQKCQMEGLWSTSPTNVLPHPLETPIWGVRIALFPEAIITIAVMTAPTKGLPTPETQPQREKE